MNLLLTAVALLAQDDLKPEWVTTEPTLPDTVEADNKDYIPLRGGGYIHIQKHPDGTTKTMRVAIGGVVAIQSDVIEVFVCAEGGKDYESAVVAQCDMQQLDLALVLCKMKKGKLREHQDQEAEGEGSRVLAFVQWKEADGTVRTCRAEDLVLDVKRNGRMPRVGWTYLGAWEQDVDPNTGKPTDRKFLRAARSKTILATFSDEGALLHSPFLASTHDDMAMYANGKALPPPGTRLRIIYRLPTAEETKEIEKLQKELAKQK